jgi:hypothetical protein
MNAITAQVRTLNNTWCCGAIIVLAEFVAEGTLSIVVGMCRRK